jgi:hypothetical protein
MLGPTAHKPASFAEVAIAPDSAPTTVATIRRSPSSRDRAGVRSVAITAAVRANIG